MIEYGHFIGGKEVKGTSGRAGDVFEPMTGELRARVAFASQAEVAAAVENAKAAQAKWAATNPQRRARVLMKFLELANRDYDKLADCLAREHGKTSAYATHYHPEWFRRGAQQTKKWRAKIRYNLGGRVSRH